MFTGQIIAAIEAVAPLALQEPWDNSGLQVGTRAGECTGVLICVDVTPAIVDEAIARGCNLIVSHHPLIFKGLKHLTGSTPVEAAVMNAIAAGITIYACHTPIDNVPGGVSYTMADMLGVHIQGALAPMDPARLKALDDPTLQTVTDFGDPAYGLGVIGDYEERPTAQQLIERVKKAFGSPVVRTNGLGVGDSENLIVRLAMCGGSGSEFIATAVQKRCQAIITSDTRYHDFVDWANDILIIDIGHWESEQCTRHIFKDIITKQYPGFNVLISETETNPIKYL